MEPEEMAINEVAENKLRRIFFKKFKELQENMLGNS